MKSIRIKLIFWVCILFAGIGALIYLPLAKNLPQKITTQILKRDIEIAKYLSGEAKELLLLNDRIALSLLLYDNLDKLQDAQYLFVQGPNGNIISHTFTRGFPKGLLSFDTDRLSPHGVKGFLSNGKRIYDIAIPILNGQLGALHLGVSMESGKKDIAEIRKINYYVAGVILVGLGIGIVVFLSIGFLFSKQIIKLKNFATIIGEGKLDEKIDINSKDEIGELALAFNRMALNLKEKIQEIKRFNTIEERNRIALDLHDGSAQDLANIIKRVELCSKLFKINPERGFEELTILKEDTKDALDRTRHIIYDLKLPYGRGFDFLGNLNNYIDKYQKDNGISVKLTTADFIGDVPENKLKQIFYIIMEALNNIKKHSSAKNVKLHLGHNGSKELTVDIKDDGMGFNAEEKIHPDYNGQKLGLVSMRQRANSLGGTLAINSAPNQGTVILVNIPLGDIQVK